MNTDKLEMVLKVAETGSIASAAKELQYSQTSLQYSIRSLEEELGISLFTRTAHGVELTAEGSRLLPNISKIVSCTNSLKNAVASLSGTEERTIRIGAYPSISRAWFPMLWKELKKLFPERKFQFISGTSNELVRLIANDTLDIYLGGNVSELLMWESLVKDEYVLILPPDFDGPILENGYPDLPYLSPDYAAADNFLYKQIFRDNTRFTPSLIASDTHDLIHMVSCGMGFSATTRLILGEDVKKVKTLTLPFPASRVIGIGTQRGKDDAAVEEIKTCLKKLIVA